MSSTNSNNDDRSSSIIQIEFNEIKGKNGFHIAYQEMREKSEKEAKENHFSTSESEKPQNRCLNRYRDVNPYDHSRIVVHRGSVDYVNANLVKLERADRKYILTQGPLSDTVGHFWLMIWEQRTKAILMLNKLVEKNQVKCHQYWPEMVGREHALKLDEVGLTVEFLWYEKFKNFCRRCLRLTDTETKQSREIIQFHYTTWPDFGIPSSPLAFLQFLQKVRISGALDPDVGPAVVHCSAGIGRSGTFCLVDCCLVLIDKEGEDKVSVKEILLELRRYRMGLIQTADQLYFSYLAIIEGIKLLKDPNLLEYDEIPGKPREQFIDIPPPLPRRTHSLQSQNGNGGITAGNADVNNKPLPTIPNESYSNEIVRAFLNKYGMNNLLNSETEGASVQAAAALNNLNRPLPPTPQQNSLDEVYDSDSNESDFFVDDSVEENDSDVANNDAENSSIEKESSENVTSNMTADMNEQKNVVKQNGVEASSPGPENELKHRKRAERQANIEQKVNEIKRKQREVEESEKTAKKRRSLVKYIAAGVLVGVLCVYAYSKLA